MPDHTQPRQPTPLESEQLAIAVAERMEYMPTEEEYQAARELVAKAYIAVFDAYTAEGSDHEEKIISVVWNIGLGYYEVYVAKDGYVEHVPQNEAVGEER